MGDSTVHDLLSDAVALLIKSGVDTPALDAELLLAETVGLSRTFVIAHPEYVPSGEHQVRFLELLNRRSERMPLAYILRRREFYGLEFEVGPGVLVPRPETERLVETAVAVLSGAQRAIADIGVGSGAIAVCLAVSLPNAQVYGTDTTQVSLDMARRNAERHRVADRVHLGLGDLFQPLKGLRFDAVVSNPPYIPSADIAGLQPEISLYEPKDALDGGRDGLDYYRRIIPSARTFLQPGGWLLVEVGSNQAKDVCEMFRESGYEELQVVNDYAGLERVVLGHM